jgi:hypothetical protein
MTSGRAAASIAAVALGAVLQACGAGQTGYPDPPAGTFTARRFTVVLEGANPADVEGAEVSPDFFRETRVRPMLGRVFIDPEHRDGGSAVAVISHGLWQERLGATPEIIGRRITIDGRLVTIVGIAPPGFTSPAGAMLWVPRKTP